MVADPGQKQDVTAKEPGVASQLSDAVTAWKKELLANYKKDGRPFPAGYAEFPFTWLPARDGVAKGNVRRSANAPNCSFFTNWTGKDDRITWDVEIVAD